MPLLTKQYISIPFGDQGVDKSVDDKYLPNGRLASALNVYYTNFGALSKRPGHNILSGSHVNLSSSISGSNFVFADDTRLYLVAAEKQGTQNFGTAVYSYVSQSLSNSWNPIGYMENTTLDTFDVGPPLPWRCEPSCVVLNNDIVPVHTTLSFSVGLTTPRLRADVLSLTNGTRLNYVSDYDPTTFSSVGGRFLTVDGRKAFAVAISPGVSQGVFHVATYDPSVAPQVVNPMGGPNFNGSGSIIFDTTSIRNVGAYLFTAAGPNELTASIGGFRLDATGGVTTSFTYPGLARGISAGTVTYNSATCPAFLYASGTLGRFGWVIADPLTLTPLLTGSTSIQDNVQQSTLLSFVQSPTDSSKVYFAYTQGVTSAMPATGAFTSFNLMPLTGSNSDFAANISKTFQWGLASKLFAQDGLVYGLLGHEDLNLDYTNELVVFSGSRSYSPSDTTHLLRPALRLHADIAGPLPRKILQEVQTLTDGSHVIAVCRADNIEDSHSGSVADNSAVVAKFRLNDNSRLMGKKIGNDVYFAGTSHLYNIGNEAQVTGYLTAPELKLRSTSGTGGFLSGGAAFPYSFVGTTEKITPTGEKYSSPPSAVLTVALTGGTTNQLSIDFNYSNLSDTLSDGNERAVLWGLYPGQQQYFRINETVITNPTLSTVTLVAQDGDPNIVSSFSFLVADPTNPDLYPSAPYCIEVAGNNLLLVTQENRTRIWISKPKVQGQGVAFSELSVYDVPDGGPITALAYYLDNVFIFKKNCIFQLQASFATPGVYTQQRIKLPLPFGCTEPRSVVVTERGVIFKGAQGFGLLDAGGNYTPIGERVKDLDQYQISSAVLTPRDRNVRFTTNSSSQPLALVYNTERDTWIQWDNHDSIVSATSWNDTYVLTRVSGSVLQEMKPHPATFDSGSYYDSTLSGLSAVNMNIKTPWLALAGTQGDFTVFNFLVLGTTYDASSFSVSVYGDYNDTTPLETYTFTATTDMVNGVAQYQFRSPKIGRKFEAIRLLISEVPVANTTQAKGFSLNEVRFEYGIRPASWRTTRKK